MCMADGLLELSLSDNAFLRPGTRETQEMGSFAKNNTMGHLDLSRCIGAPGVFAEAILSCRFLQRLVLYGVPAVTDDLVRIVTCGCLHLTHLLVAGCTSLSGECKFYDGVLLVRSVCEINQCIWWVVAFWE